MREDQRSQHIKAKIAFSNTSEAKHLLDTHGNTQKT